MIEYGLLEDHTHLSLQQNFNSETVFLFCFQFGYCVQFCTSPRVTKQTVKKLFFYLCIFLLQNAVLKCIYSQLSRWPMIMPFCFDPFSQKYKFNIENTNIDIFLKFLERPMCQVTYFTFHVSYVTFHVSRVTCL